MTLIQGKVGHQYIVERLDLSGVLEKRLEALGLTIGTKVLLLNRKANGSLIFKVRGTRLAVGKDIAHAIVIKED